jgi:(p)ppGpp synthase/HD superfamily hydrolase
MKYLNQFHKESSERKMRKMAEWKGQPTSDNEAVTEMFRNHRTALAMEKGENVKDRNNNMITIEEVLQIALWAHRGQVDQNGNPTILHSLALGLAGKNREEMIAGFLHNALDTPRVIVDYLRAAGVD